MASSKDTTKAKKGDTPTAAAKKAPATKPAAAKKGDDKEPKKRRVRTVAFRAMTKVPLFRRFYVRRILRFIEKSKAKGRPLPADLVRVDQMTAKLPKKKKEKLLEEAMLPSQTDEIQSRELRRAAAKQDRLRGSGGGRRPGSATTGGRPVQRG